MPPAPTVFISYSHEDEVWKDRLVKQLAVLQKQSLLETWDDRRIRAGEDWLEEIRKGMATARVAVFLVSADSLTSDFILHTEIPGLLERRERDGMTVFPVICTDCLWEEVPWLSRLQARPKDGQALASYRGNRVNVELKKIAQEILAILRNGAPHPQPVTVTDPPKPTTSLAPLHQLPTPPADFTGREEDLEFLRSRLAEGGTGAMFGLRGMGGVGKTTLALKLAEELKPRFPDAQIYLDLKGVDPQPLTAAQAMGHVVRSFHPEARLPEGEAELAGLYRSVLDGKRVLLLMDNATKDKKQVEPLIPPPTCLLLVTSRFRFALPGLVDRDLDEMSKKDARDLLLRIAPRIGDNADEIAGLCGCLPLALRLAGSALAERPDLSPAEYIRRRREGKEKLEPVEASLQTSYDLLTEERQRLWRLLAVFSGTFDSEAVKVVWELDIDDTKDHLGELLRSSLVEWEEMESRYRLHDLARDFARRQVNADEWAVSQQGYAKHFLEILALTDDLYERGGESVRKALKLFDTEWENIKAAQNWASSNCEQNEEIAWLCDAFPDAGALLLRLRLSPWDQILWRKAGLSAAIRRKNRENQSFHLLNLGSAYTQLGKTSTAIDCFEQALATAHEANSTIALVDTFNNLGLLCNHTGEHRLAVEFFNKSLALSREIADQRREAHALGNLSTTYLDVGDIPRALESCSLHLQMSRNHGDHRGEVNALNTMGLVHLDLEDYERAIQSIEESINLSKERGDWRGGIPAMASLSTIYLHLGDPKRAVELLEKCMESASQEDDHHRLAGILGNLGVAKLALGELRESLDFSLRSFLLAQEIGSRHCQALASWNLGLICIKSGDLARGLDWMKIRTDYDFEIGHPEAEKRAAYVAALRARIAEQKSES